MKIVNVIETLFVIENTEEILYNNPEIDTRLILLLYKECLYTSLTPFLSFFI